MKTMIDLLVHLVSHKMYSTAELFGREFDIDLDYELRVRWKLNGDHNLHKFIENRLWSDTFSTVNGFDNTDKALYKDLKYTTYVRYYNFIFEDLNQRESDIIKRINPEKLTIHVKYCYCWDWLLEIDNLKHLSISGFKPTEDLNTVLGKLHLKGVIFF